MNHSGTDDSRRLRGEFWSRCSSFSLLINCHTPSPKDSFGSVTRGYGCSQLASNSYPQGESGPAGITSFWVSAAARSRASIQLLAVTIQ